MEKLQNDLFNDPKIESKVRPQAGRPSTICDSAMLGGSVCWTNGGQDLTFDTVP